MANYSVTPKYGTAADVVAVAKFLAQRQSDSGTTNGGIVANGNPAVPLLAQGGVNDTNGLATAYMQGIADAVMCAVGFQYYNEQQGTNSPVAITGGLNWANAAYGIVSFNAPIAKTYVVHVDSSFYLTVGSSTTVASRLVLDGSTPYPSALVYQSVSAIGLINSVSFRVAIPFTAGSHTLQLQWSTDVNATVNANGNCRLGVVITG